MRVKSARSIRKGASSGQTAASLVENHARKPPSSALIANHASKPALFEVPFKALNLGSRMSQKWLPYRLLGSMVANWADGSLRNFAQK